MACFHVQCIVKLGDLLPEDAVMAANLDIFKRGLEKLMEDKTINDF